MKRENEGKGGIHATAIHNNGLVDALNGGPGSALDWSIAGALDVIKNQRTGEVVTVI